MNVQHIKKLYSLLGHTGYYSRVGSLDTTTKRYEDKLLSGFEEVIAYARKWDGKRNVFIGRNPRNSSGDVVCSSSITFDIDPIREPGKAANDEQHSNAISAGQRILDIYPGGHLCSSGNGCLLLYHCNIGRDGLGLYYRKEKIFIEQLNILVKDLEVKVDATSYEEAVIKLVGTISTKGDSKYHRLSRFLTFSTTSPRESIYKIIESVSIETSKQQDIQKFVGDPVERLQKAQECLQKLGKEYYDDYEKWTQAGMSLREFGISGLQLWIHWSKQSEKYEESICEEKWKTFDEIPSLTLASLIAWANETNRIGRVNEHKSSLNRDSYFSQLFQLDSGHIKPIFTGISSLDTCLRALPRGEITTIAARSGYGKTSISCSIAENNRCSGKKVLYFSTEIPENFLMHKFTSLATGISTQSLIDKSNLQMEIIQPFQRAWEQNPVIICDEDRPSIQFVEDQIEQYKPDLVVIDHVTHIEKNWEKIANYMRDLKVIAKKFDIPILNCAQLGEPPRGKDGTVVQSVRGDVRGSEELIYISAIFATLNNIYEVKGDTQPVMFRIEKNRWGIGNAEIEIQIDKSTGKFHD